MLFVGLTILTAGRPLLKPIYVSFRSWHPVPHSTCHSVLDTEPQNPITKGIVNPVTETDNTFFN
jgi:hypothetical protein